MSDSNEKGSPLSIRFPPWLDAKVREEASLERRTLAEMVRILAEEALATRAFPSIIFVDGPTGRRATFRDGPDVWEIVESYLASDRDPVATAESWPHLPPWKVSTAIRYYELFPTEIEARIQRNAAS